MPRQAKIPLLEADPEFGVALTDEERHVVQRVTLPVRELPRGEVALGEQLDADGEFGAILIEGAILQRARIGEQATVRLFGAGDLIASGAGGRSSLIAEASLCVVGGARVALLGNEFLMAVRRWPSLAATLYLRLSEQVERTTAQLVISQLPRVGERILGVLWLLAESWGHVTPAGVSLPLALTHDTLGGLIGARRSTVTLAMGELIDRGAVVRQDKGWLLLESLPEVNSAAVGNLVFEPFPRASSAWGEHEVFPRDPAIAHAELLETVERLRSQHTAMRESVRNRLVEVGRTRDRVAQRRTMNEPRGATPRSAPSA
jgi:CRP-like cAMP-binding protein